GLDEEVLPRAADLLDDVAGTLDDRLGIDPRGLTDGGQFRAFAHRRVDDNCGSDANRRSQQPAPLLPFHELDNRITVRSPFWVLGSCSVSGFGSWFCVRGSRCSRFDVRRRSFYIRLTGYRSQELEPSHDDLRYSQDTSTAYAVLS